MNTEELVKLFSSRSPWVRMDALKDETGVDATTQLLVARAGVSDPHPSVRCASLDVIGKYGSRQDTHRLMIATRDDAWEVRSSAVDSIGYLKISKLKLRVLEMFCTDRHFIVRRDAASALPFVSKYAYYALLDRLDAESNQIVRVSILQSMYALGDREKLRDLMLLLAHEDDLVRDNVINGLRLIEIAPDDREELIAAIHGMIERETNRGNAGDAEILLSEL